MCSASLMHHCTRAIGASTQYHITDLLCSQHIWDKGCQDGRMQMSQSSRPSDDLRSTVLYTSCAVYLMILMRTEHVGTLHLLASGSGRGDDQSIENKGAWRQRTVSIQKVKLEPLLASKAEANTRCSHLLNTPSPADKKARVSVFPLISLLMAAPSASQKESRVMSATSATSKVIDCDCGLIDYFVNVHVLQYSLSQPHRYQAAPKPSHQEWNHDGDIFCYISARVLLYSDAVLVTALRAPAAHACTRQAKQ